MNEEDLKRILDEKLEPIRGDLKQVQGDLKQVQGDLKQVKQTQEEHTRRLEALAGDTEELLNKTKGLKDAIGLWHQRDKREINEIKRHLDLPVIPDIPQV